MKVRIEKATIEELVDVLDVISDAKQDGQDLILEVTDASRIKEVFKDRDIVLSGEFIVFSISEETAEEPVETKTEGKLTIDDIWKQHGFLEKHFNHPTPIIDIDSKIEGVEDVALTKLGIRYKIKDCQCGDHYFGNYTVYDNGEISIVIVSDYMFEEYDEEDDYNYIDHPHVRESEPCFGNISENLKHTKDLNVRIMLIKEFLNSYDPEDGWGSAFRFFPKVSEVEEFING